jgi:hypothetical protein
MTGSGGDDGDEFGAERAAEIDAKRPVDRRPSAPRQSESGAAAMPGRALVYASPFVVTIATVPWRRGELPRPAAFQP